MVVWIIGMSGAGKTTIGSKVCELLRRENGKVVFIDGDSIRKIMGNDLGHTIEDRRKNAMRIQRLCQFLDSQGVDVVCAILSIFHESQDWNRENIEQYFEVFLDVPFDILLSRDPKGLYKKSLEGKIDNVVGVDIEFPAPKRPDLTISDSSDRSIASVAQQIFDAIAAEKKQ